MKYLFFVIFLFIVMYLIYYSNFNIEISRFVVKNRKIPAEFDGFKIIQISDLQNNNWGGKLEKLVEREEPDIILITGDLLDSYNTKIDLGLKFVEDIIKYSKVFFVTGNHEAKISDYEDFERKLKNLGVRVLNDEVFEFFYKDTKINILGISDPYFISNKKHERIVMEKLQKLNYDNSFTILLSHRPEHFKLYTNRGIDLVFSGHAHGGQFIIPFINRGLFAPNQGIFPKYTGGLYEDENTKMIVSRGLGNSKLRYRINNIPELVVVELRSEIKRWDDIS